MIVDNFLNVSASQLTWTGLKELKNNLSSGELGVFFRNNHFSVIYKHEGNLYLLVTDLGFLRQKRIMWELLDNVCFFETKWSFNWTEMLTYKFHWINALG